MSRLYNIFVAIIDKLIIANSTNNYIKIGTFAMCWGRKTPSSINSTMSVSFPITFASAPYGFASWHASAKGSTYNQLGAYDESTTGMTIYYYEASGNVRTVNWLAVGFISGGGYCIAVFSMLSAISSFVRGWRHEQVIQHIGRSRHQSDNVYTYNTHRERVRSKDRRPLRKSHGAYSRRVRFSLLDMGGAKRMVWCNHTVKSEARHNKLLCTICVERIISKWQLRCSCAIPKANNLIHNTPERGCVA